MSGPEPEKPGETEESREPESPGETDERGPADVGGEPPGLPELFLTFLKISLLGFGGPNAHLALILDEVVERRRWIDREHFLHLIGITNLLPGPNSSEVTIHIGYTQRGWRGAVTTGLAFLLPTFFFVVTLSWLYFRFGTLPAVEPLFWGLKPVIVAIILWAGWRLGREAVDRRRLVVLGVGGLLVTLVAGRWAVAAMIVGGALTWLEHRRESRGASGRGSGRGGNGGDGGEGEQGGGVAGIGGAPGEDIAADEGGGGTGSSGVTRSGLFPFAATGLGVTGLTGAVGAAGVGAFLQVFWLHLWIGSVLFGGGYVLVALLEPYAVDSYGWLTQAQFLDGVALTQAVPGPISTLSAFVGFAAAGPVGAVLATGGLYLPAFGAVLLVAPHLERLRHLDVVRATLSGVNAVVAGAILGVGISLVPAAVPGWGAALLFLGALAGRGALGISAPWLVLGGLGAGGIATLLA